MILRKLKAQRVKAQDKLKGKSSNRKRRLGEAFEVFNIGVSLELLI
jgi:hypothetical protein